MTPFQIFDLAYDFDRSAEGGYWDDPTGGPTNFGIRQSTFTAWLTKQGLPNADVRAITDDQVRAINYSEYWLNFHLDQVAEIAPATATTLYDMSENIWDVRAIEMLQRRIGVTPDSVIGPATLAALKAAITNAGGDLAFSVIYNNDRIAWYEAKSPAADVSGLVNRVHNIETYILQNFSTPPTPTDAIV